MPQVSRGPTRSPMQYQVLARKWRPQNFRELVGQGHVSRTLLNALQSGRVAHAFLFSGPRGSGKTTTARILAKALNCRAGNTGEPCGQCVACSEIAAGNCMDVLEIDAASNRGIDEIRELREKVRYSPARDRNKIFIIDEVHMLTPEAFNALLKTLEEPPPHVVFIMATTEYHKIPATILSRCQQYSFKLLPFPLILSRLRQIAEAEKIQISARALEQVAYSSGGSMRDAMSALDQVIAFSGETVNDDNVTMLLGLVEPRILGDVVRAVAKNDTEKILGIVGDLVESGQDLQNFCRRLLGQFRNLMVLKTGVSDPALLGVPESLVPEVRAQAELFSREDLLRLFDALLKVEAELKYATQPRFQLEMGLIELAQLARLRSLEDLIADFTNLAQGAPPKPAAQPGPSAPTPPPVPAVSSRPPRVAPISRAPFDSATAEMRRVSAEPAPTPPAQGPEPPSLSEDQAPGVDPRELLLKIAERIHKESLQPILEGLQGAHLEGDSLVLDLGEVSEFSRRQVKENIELVTQAASEVVGQPVTVRMGETAKPMESDAESGSGRGPGDGSSRMDVLERAKREPVVRSFLDIFPGPVKAEELDK